VDPITVIVRFTGLALFSTGPTQMGQSSPTYVLFPATPASASHVAQIGFRQDTSTADCDDFSHQICYHDISNLSITLGQQGGVRPSGSLPPGNITGATHRRIAGGHFRPTGVPGNLHARVILNEGRQDGTCSVGLYTFGNDSAEVELANVVQWSYNAVGGTELHVVGTPLRGGSGATLWRAPVDSQRRAEIFLRHVTRHDIATEDNPDPLPTPPQAAAHYRHLYTLLDPQPDSLTPVPVYRRRNPRVPATGCTWAREMTFRHGIPKRLIPAGHEWSVGTLTCTVGKADPP